MHLCTVFGRTLAELMNTMTHREFMLWRLYVKVFGPIHWRRQDWNFAKIQDDICGGRDSTSRDSLLNFEYVEEKSGVENGVQALMAFGLPQKDIDELTRLANG